MKKKRKLVRKLLSFLLTLAMVMGMMPWISLPADAATAKEVAVNETSLLERDKEPSLNVMSANEASLPDHVKRAKDGTLTYSEDGLGTGNFAEEAIEGGTVYRLYNKNSGEHFYTLSVGERDSVVKAGWTDEGVAYDASVKASDSDAVPVYRVFNPNAPADNSSHHYTCNAAEAQNLVSHGWRFEGVGFYVFPADRKNGMTVYREYNKNDGGHNYTTNKEEHDFLMKAGWADENTAWKVKDVREVGTQKELEAVLATTSLTDLKIATNKKVELSIPEEDYSLVDLIVDAPKASITNAGEFRSIDLRSIAADTWTECGNNNNIVVNNSNRVHIIVDTLNRLSSLIFAGNITGVNTLEVNSGTLDQLIVTQQDPIDVSVSGEAKVGSVSVNAGTNVNVAGKDKAAIGAVDVTAAGAKVSVSLSGESTAREVTVSKDASSTEGEKTSVTVSAEDKAAVGTVEMKAAGAKVAVSLFDDSTLGEMTVSKEASSTEDEKTNVTVYAEDNSAVGTVGVEAAGTDVSVSASGKSTINEVTVAETASSTGTSVDIKADGTAKIESVTTSAEGANVSVTSNGQSTVDNVKVEGSAQATVDGDSSNKTTVDITGAGKEANVVVKKDSVEVETTPDTDTSSIVDNSSGSTIPTSSKDSSDNETSGSIPPKDGGSGSGGGSSEGGSGGGSGGGSSGGSSGGGSYTPSVEVTGVSLDNYYPKVGDKITAKAEGSGLTADNIEWTVEVKKGSSEWYPIKEEDYSEYGITTSGVTLSGEIRVTYVGCVLKITATANGTSMFATTPGAVVESYKINFNAAPTGGTVAVKVGKEDITPNGLAAANDTISITATPTDGYTLTALTATGEGGQLTFDQDVAETGGTYKFSMSASDVTVEATFAEKTVKSIAVKNAPTKTTYASGEHFDPTGLVLNVTYSDNSVVEVPYAGNTDKFLFSPDTSTVLATENNSVTISYGTPSKTTTQTITVKAASDLNVSADKSVLDIEETATLTNSGSGTGALTYTSSDENVATVADGTVTAVAAGTATITITQAETTEMFGKSVEVEIKVRAASTLALTSPAILTLVVGAESQIEASATTLMTFMSNAPGVATVDKSSGLIKAVAAGTATITITAAESDRFSEGTAEVTVTVS